MHSNSMKKVIILPRTERDFQLQVSEFSIVSWDIPQGVLVSPRLPSLN